MPAPCFTNPRDTVPPAPPHPAALKHISAPCWGGWTWLASLAVTLGSSTGSSVSRMGPRRRAAARGAACSGAHAKLLLAPGFPPQSSELIQHAFEQTMCFVSQPATDLGQKMLFSVPPFLPLCFLLRAPGLLTLDIVLLFDLTEQCRRPPLQIKNSHLNQLNNVGQEQE